MRVVYLVAFLMAIKVSAQGFEFNSDKIKGIIENQIQSLDPLWTQEVFHLGRQTAEALSYFLWACNYLMSLD